MIKNQVSYVLPVGGGTTKKNTSTNTNGLYGEMLNQNTKISLPSQGNTDTGGLYGQVIGTGNTTPAVASQLSPNIPTGLESATPTLKIDNSQYFDSNIVKKASDLSGSGSNGGVTDEGVITGNSNVNNSTFNNTSASKTTTATTATANDTSNSKTTISSIWEKIKGSNFVSGVKDVISRLFGVNTSSTTESTKTATGTDGSGTTYAENIGTGTSNTETTETATTENKAGATASTDNTAESTTTTTEEKPMTYTEYLEQMKNEALESKQESDKQAEIAKERAMVDAQSSYAQNKATYGANAETMAQMGLQGGGYSDYLQAQAYAQKRSDVQQANAVESATKAQNQATYREYINSINQSLAENALYNERLADERAYNEQQTTEQRAYEEEQSKQSKKDSLYATLWEGVQDTDTTYTAEAIRVIGEEYGLSEAQITTLTNLLTATLSKSEEETSSALKDAAIEDITLNGGDVSDGYLDGLKDLGLTDEDAQKVQDAINNSITNSAVTEIDNAIKSGDIDTLEYTISKADDYYAKGNITKEKYQELYSTYSTYCVNQVMSIDYGSDYSKKLTSYLSQKTELKEMLNAGKISQETYTSLITKMESQNSNSCSGGWYIQGLGSGRENDDIDITIGGTSRNKSTEYDLLCGEKIGDEALIAELNRIATGNPNTSPAVESGWTWLHGDEASSNKTPGKLIVAYGDMYLYTSKGWVSIKDDNNSYDLQNAIRKFLGTSNSTSETSTVEYPSDSEIASKASSGTLTYNDVAKYNPGIRTASEFARGNNADKQKYGTYQAYLKAMYEKYKK